MSNPLAPENRSSDNLSIDLRDVSVVRQDTPILDNVTWQVPRGGCAAILGPNGSGKTTLTRVIAGYEWPSSGRVTVLGQTLGQTDVRKLRQRLAVVNPAERFGVNAELTAQQVVLTGCFGTLGLYDQPTSEQADKADHLLCTVGLSHRNKHRYGLLSTGEQRRCLLARAMIDLPELLILDEPTAGLDIAGREHLLATLEQMLEKPDAPTLILVTHHVEELARATSQVIMLREGRIIAHGPPDTTITPETLSRVMGCKVFVSRRAGRFWLEVLPEAWPELLNSRPEAHVL